MLCFDYSTQYLKFVVLYISFAAHLVLFEINFYGSYISLAIVSFALVFIIGLQTPIFSKIALHKPC